MRCAYCALRHVRSGHGRATMGQGTSAFPDRRDTMSRRTPSKAPVVAGIAMAAFLLGGSASSAQQASEAAGQIERFKTSVTNGVESRRKLAQVINDTVFSFGELAYQEFETSKYLTTLLENNGFTVEPGIPGIPTAWVAPRGSGHPAISLGSDIDCLPKASQKPGISHR